MEKEIIVGILENGDLKEPNNWPQIISTPNELNSDEIVKTIMTFVTWVRNLPNVNDWDKVDRLLLASTKACRNLKTSIDNTREVDSNLNINEKNNPE